MTLALRCFGMKRLGLLSTKSIPPALSCTIQKTNIKSQHMCTSADNRYEELYKQSIEKPEQFWGELAEDITWFKKYDQVLDDAKSPFTKWFVGGEMNTCYEAIDKHLEAGFGQDLAMIYDSPVTDTKKHITYECLQQQVSKFARVLINLGVKKGDRVIIYMPMIPEAIIAMYGCARIGAIHSVVFGGFASKELARRIDHAEPVILITASCGVEPKGVLPYGPLVEKAIKIASHKPRKIITVDREQCRKQTWDNDVDLRWEEVMDHATSHDCVPVDANDPLYILYTSGTTGEPKGIVRPSGGHAVALKWSMKNLYDIQPNDTWWAASDIGWVVGHSYIVYAPLLNRNTSILFEGKPVGCPDASTFFRVIDEHSVAALFTAPTAIRVIRNEDPAGEQHKNFAMDKFKYLFLAGENCDLELLEWTCEAFRKPAIDHWWQTESGWPITNHHVGLGLPSDYKLGTVGKPTPGWNVQVLDDDLNQCEPGQLGRVHVKLPLPPGAMSNLWRNDDRFVEAYFRAAEGYYDSCDAGTLDENGYLQIGGRVDDVINVAGHRLSTKQMEMAIAHHDEVMEEAVIGVRDAVKGLSPVALIVLKKGSSKDENLIKEEVVKLVRKDIGPVAALKRVIVVPTLPKTRAGKIIRGTMKKILDGDSYNVPETVDNIDDFFRVEKILTAES